MWAGNPIFLDPEDCELPTARKVAMEKAALKKAAAKKPEKSVPIERRCTRQCRVSGEHVHPAGDIGMHVNIYFCRASDVV